MNRLHASIPIAFITVLFVTVGLSAHTYAYIDLGTGSYMLQMLTAGLFGVIFAARSLMGRVVTFFRRSPDRER